VSRHGHGELAGVYEGSVGGVNEFHDRNRPITTVSIRFPVDVIEDLKRVAPLRGFSGYQPLVRAYIGQELRIGLERLDNATVAALVESLKRRGVNDEVI
jgi:hypothetical protein